MSTMQKACKYLQKQMSTMQKACKYLNKTDEYNVEGL